jgi:hypothetical protein
MYVFICTSIYVYVCMCVRMYICLCVRMYICMYARNNTYVHTNTHQYTMLEHVTITNTARQFCWHQPDVPFQLVPLYTSSAQCHYFTDTQCNLTSPHLANQRRTPIKHTTQRKRTTAFRNNRQIHYSPLLLPVPGAITNNTILLRRPLNAHSPRTELLQWLQIAATS